MTRLPYEERLAQIKPLHEQGLNYRQIAEEIGVASSTMSVLMQRAIESGDIKSRRVPSLRQSKVRAGSISSALRGQSPDFINWLITETRGSITVAELAVSIMLDAFHEETDE